jgi:hypothetical protein
VVPITSTGCRLLDIYIAVENSPCTRPYVTSFPSLDSPDLIRRRIFELEGSSSATEDYAPTAVKPPGAEIKKVI